ncbi:MAG TPA: RNA 2',3'-cyclic phosphodiesterase [bacterium]|nr:RNA 2',3'-cyclic phosphodiesterase [bacterium]
MAVPISPALVEGISGILAKVSKHRGIRWVLKAQLHITLRFIGTFEESQVPKLEQVLGEVSITGEPFEAELGGLGAFPRLDRPRVLFIPVIRGEEGFRRLEAKMTPALEGLGIKPDEKEYHPHLTLGRVRENENPRQAVEALQEACRAHWEPWKVDRFILFKSQLAPGGSVYTRLKEFEFGKG